MLNGIRDSTQRASVVVPWSAVSGSAIGVLAAKFDIVLGYTPSENAAPARPTLVAVGGVVDAASYYPVVAAGSWVTLYGANLATTTRDWSASDIVDGSLPQTLDGVSVRINDKPAAVGFISPKQINVQAPGDAAIGTVQVTISNASGTSDPVTVDSKTVAPALFQIAQEYVSAVRSDGVSIGPAGLVDGVTTVPARPGDRVTLFGSGFGATNPETPSGKVVLQAAPLANPVTVRIDLRSSRGA